VPGLLGSSGMEILDGVARAALRYDDVKSSHDPSIDGEGTFARLRQKSQDRRRA